MAGYILLGVLASFGLLCAIWTLFGWLLSCGGGGALVCLCRPGFREVSFIQRYHFLRSVGLLRCPMLLVDCDLPQREQTLLCRKYPGIEFCSRSALASRLEVERDQLDRA